MSAEASGWVWKHRTHTGNVLIVQLAIADSVNDMNNNEFWMSRRRLAEKTGVSTRSVGRSLDTLVGEGYLEILTQGGGSDVSRYRVMMEHRGGCHHDTGVSASSLPMPNGAFIPLTNPIEPNITDGDALFEAPLQSHSILAYEKEFTIVWDVYPRKIARKAALGKYVASRKKGATAQDLLAATAHYADDPKRNPDFTMHAATFFGPNERWRDYLKSEPGAESPNTVNGQPVQAGTALLRRPPANRGVVL